MADSYVVINRTRQIYYLDEKTLLDMLNEPGVPKEERRNWVVLPMFPLPTRDSMVHISKGKDAVGRLYGQYCPFGHDGSWPENALVILKNGAEFFVPPMKEVTKTVVTKEYSLSVEGAEKPARKRSRK